MNLSTSLATIFILLTFTSKFSISVRPQPPQINTDPKTEAAGWSAAAGYGGGYMGGGYGGGSYMGGGGGGGGYMGGGYGGGGGYYYPGAPPGGYGWGYGGFGAPPRGRIVRASVVCREKGACYMKKLKCPARCFHSFHRSGKGYAYGGGGGGCTLDCANCVAHC